MKQHWTKGGDGITNFEESDRPIYEAAIAEYGDNTLYISEEGLGGHPFLALCGNPLRKDLGAFWRIHARIKGVFKVQDPEEVLP